MKHKSVIALLALIVAVVAASCSKTADLLDSVPADTHGVAVVDVTALVEAAGCGVDDNGNVTLPQGLTLAPAMRLRLDEVQALAKGTDLRSVVLAAHTDNDIFATLAVTDRGAVEKALPAAGFTDSGKTDGYRLFSSPVSKIYIGGAQAWIFPASSSATPGDVLANATDNSVRKELPGVSSYLEQGKMIAIAASTRAAGFSPVGQDTWLCVDIEPAGKNLTMTQRTIDAQGTTMPNSSLRSLDPQALALLPGNWPLTIAAGLNKNIDWSGLVSVGAMFGGFQMMGMIESIVPYLEAIEGTVEFAAQPVDADSWQNVGIADWNFIFAAQMPDADGAKAVEALRSYLKRLMIDTAPIDNGFAVRQPGLDLKATAAGGMLVISKGTVTATGAPASFAGNSAAARIVLPKGFIIDSAPIELNGAIKGDETTVTLSLPGTEANVLQTILKEFAR